MSDFLKKSKDILGMNARNFLYLKPYNFKAGRQRADDKLLTKSLLEKADLPVPKTFAIIKDLHDLSSYDFSQLPRSFVLKPNMGFGGDGIKVIFGRKKNGHWVASSQQEVTEDNLKFHINEILDGYYSLSHVPDIAFFEQRIRIHKDLKLYSYKGIPDVRVIVFNGIPVMAMLRLPTKASGGKANMMLGGIGVGIDISTGITTHAVLKNNFLRKKHLEFLPGTRIPLSGIEIPHWQEILKIAVAAADVVGLGYSGIDIAIDKEEGPVILEVNARPGLEIQNANNATLGDRLRRVSGLKVKTVQKGISIAKELFGGDIHEELKAITGRQVLGVIEKVTIHTNTGKSDICLKVKVDTGAQSSSIDAEIACQLGFKDAIEYAEKLGAMKKGSRQEIEKLHSEIKDKLEEHPQVVKSNFVHNSNGSTVRIYVPLEITLGKRKFIAHVNVMNRSHMMYPMIIGRNDLKQFIIDPAK